MSRPVAKRSGAAGCLLLALSPAPDLHAQPIGRLFSTPEQRAALDAMRDDPGFGRKPAPPAAATGTEPAAGSGPEPAPEPALPAVTLNGVVLRGGVRRVSWINGVAVDTGAVAPGGIRIDAGRVPGGRFRIRLPDVRSTIDLKPGQKAGVVKGRVLEGYEHTPAPDVATAPGGLRAIGSGAALSSSDGGATGDPGAATASSPAVARRSGGGPIGGHAGPFGAADASSPSAVPRVEGRAAGEVAAASAASADASLPIGPISPDAATAGPAAASGGAPGPARPPALPASLVRALLRQSGADSSVSPVGSATDAFQDHDDRTRGRHDGP